MKSSATPTVTKITGEPIENSFLTSSFFSRGDLMGGIVPAHTNEIKRWDFFRQYKVILLHSYDDRQFPEMPCRKNLWLTAVVVQCRKLGALVPTAGAVTGFHLQLIPGGLTQLCQEHIHGGVGAHILPRPRACNKQSRFCSIKVNLSFEAALVPHWKGSATQNRTQP